MLQVPTLEGCGTETESSVQSMGSKSRGSGGWESPAPGCIFVESRCHLCLRLFGKILLFLPEVSVLWLRCTSAEENQPQ